MKNNVVSTMLSYLMPVHVEMAAADYSPNMLYWVLPDKNARGEPATHKSLDDRMIPVTTAMNAYIHAIEKLLNPSLTNAALEHGLGGLFGGATAWSNGHPYGGGDWKIENLDCGGATALALNNKLLKHAGILWKEFQALDPKHMPNAPVSLAALSPLFHFVPTIAVKSGLNPFPQFNGRCAVPRFGIGGVKTIQWSAIKAVSSVGNACVPVRLDVQWW